MIGKADKSDFEQIMWIGYFAAPDDVINAFINRTDIDNKYLELFNEVNKVVYIYYIRKGSLVGIITQNLSEIQCKLWHLWAIIKKYKSKYFS